jgi:hypothetical protein
MGISKVIKSELKGMGLTQSQWERKEEVDNRWKEKAGSMRRKRQDSMTGKGTQNVRTGERRKGGRREDKGMTGKGT